LSAIVKASIETVYYGAPQEDHNNPDIRAADIKARTSTPLELHAGIMKERFKEQIRRGRQALEQAGKAPAPKGFKEE
jgi:hypothetical protein